MGDKLYDLMSVGADFMRLVFTTETKDECKKIFDMYSDKSVADFDFTRLHYYKGVM